MSPEDIKKGDVVRFKSGGPKMTVKFIDDMRGCMCKWFDNKDKIKDDFFSKEQLEKVEDENESDHSQDREYTY